MPNVYPEYSPEKYYSFKNVNLYRYKLPTRAHAQNSLPDKSCLPSVKSTISISSDPKFIILVKQIEILVSHKYHLFYPSFPLCSLKS